MDSINHDGYFIFTQNSIIASWLSLYTIEKKKRHNNIQIWNVLIIMHAQIFRVLLVRFVSVSVSSLTRFIALIFAIVEFRVKIFKLFVREKKTNPYHFISFAHSLINPKQCYIIATFLHGFLSLWIFDTGIRIFVDLRLSASFSCVGIFMDFL